MAEHRTQLAQFGLLLNGATAAMKAAGIKAEGVKDAKWKKASAEVAEALAKGVHELPVTAGYYSNHGQNGAKASKSAAFEQLGKHGETLVEALGKISEADEDAAAEAVADHLCLAFERNGAAHLAWPYLGTGLKVGGKKADPDLFHWTSGWGSRAGGYLSGTKIAAAAGRHTDDEARDRILENAGPEEAEVLTELRRYWSGVHNANVGASGEHPWDGVHLESPMPGVGNSEEPIESVENGLGMGDVRDRIAATALCKILGDKTDAGEAASAGRSPRALLEAALLADLGPEVAKTVGGARGLFKMEAKLASRAKSPALTLLQAARSATVARAGGDGRWHEQSEYALYDKGLAEMETLAKLSTIGAKVEAEFRVAGDKVMAKAFAVAKVRQAEWLEKAGFAKAWKDARALNSGRSASIKAVNWAKRNSAAADAAQAAEADPEMGLAGASARYLGLLGDTPEQVKASAVEAWAERGLSPEAFAKAAASEKCSAMLSDACGKALQTKKTQRGAKETAEQTVELLAATLTAAFAEGASGDGAGRFAAFALQQSDMFIRISMEEEWATKRERVNWRIVPKKISNAAAGKTTLEMCAARKEAYADVLRLLWKEAQASGIEGAGTWNPRPLRTMLERFCVSADGAPDHDWLNADLKVQTFEDLSLRRSPKFATAVRSAIAEGGEHGKLAGKIAQSVGILEAESGNELIGKVKAALKEHMGLSESGWKALGKPESNGLRQEIETALGGQEMTALREAVREEKGLTGRLMSQRLAHQSWEWKTWVISEAARLGFTTEDAGTLIELEKNSRGQLLNPKIRAIEVSDEASSRMAWREAQAKESRLGGMAKSICEEIRKKAKKFEAEGQDAAMAKAVALREMRNEAALVSDWLDRSEDGVWQTLPEKTTWAVLMRRQAEWHDEVVARAAAGQAAPGVKGKAEAASWNTPLTLWNEKQWSAVELASGSALSEEGTEMRHCVSSYAGTCKSGNSRIYSVRLNGERHCTVEFKLKGPDGREKAYSHAYPQPEDSWHLVQNRGKCNATITDANALKFCEGLGKALNAAHLTHCEALAKKRSEEAKERAATKKKSEIVIVGAEAPKAKGPKA